MHKAVTDSNILVSSSIVKMGVPNQIVRQAGISFILCICEEILQETERILRTDRLRKKYRYTDDDLAEFLIRLRDPHVAQMVKDLPQVAVIQDDASDNVIVACAQKVEAEYVVTGDQHLLHLKMAGLIKIVTPREFLTLLANPS